MNFRRLFAAALCVLLLWGVMPLQADAAQDEEAKCFNIMIVMDCSGSLVQGITSDPYGYRYDATSMFLDLLSESGNQVGAIVFNSTSSMTDSSDASMREGLRLNTGLRQIRRQQDKDELMAAIRSIKPGGYTDIGTALLAAAEHLKGMEAENGLESIILLFTDGATETRDKYLNPGAADEKLPVYTQSLKNRDAAVELIRSEGITLCGVYLRDGAVDPEKNEVLQLVRQANGYDESATQNQVGDLFIQVEEASSLAEAYQRFFTLVSGTGAEPFEGEKKFRIPGNGVTDVNISITVRQSSLEKCAEVLNSLKVTLTRPDNTTYTPRELAEILSLGSSYAVLKIQNPEAGPWKIEIESPEAEVDTSILINTSVSAEVAYSVEAQNIELGKAFSVAAKLTRNGTPFASAEDYREYTGRLVVQNADTMEEWPVELTYDATDNAYTGQLFVQEYGEYYAHVEFTCGDSVKIVTPMQYWFIRNSVPEAPTSHYAPVELSLLSNGTGQIDLRSLVSDKEDEREKITISLDRGTYPEEACWIEDGILHIDGAVGGSGCVLVTFTDTAGGSATTEIRIHFDNKLPDQIRLVVICACLAAALLIVRAVMRWARKRMGAPLPGVVQMTVPVTGSVHIVLRVDAQSCVNRTLYDVLKENRGILVDNAAYRYCSEAEVDQFLSKGQRSLSNVRITSVQKKKSDPAICQITGLSGSVKEAGLRDQESVEIPVQGAAGKIVLEYNRFH